VGAKRQQDCYFEQIRRGVEDEQMLVLE
jgi:hypothetical protein